MNMPGPNNPALPSPARNTPLITLVWRKSAGRDGVDARHTVKRMMENSIGPYGTNAVIGGDEALCWGLLLPDDPTPITCWSIFAGRGDLCLFEGEMYDDPPGLGRLSGHSPQIAGYVAGLMAKDPWGEMPGLNGVYSGLYIGRGRKNAYAFGDAPGTRPVFWYSDERFFIVSNNLWAFRGCDQIRRTLDPMTLAQTMTIGFPLRGRTWISGVRMLQPGFRVCSSAEGTTGVRRVTRPLERGSWSFDRTVSELRGAADHTVKRICERLGNSSVLGLSGGLDSRILLASLHAQHIPHTSLTFCGEPGEPDSRLAASATSLLGERHSTLVIDNPLAMSLYRDLRIINEGESPGFGFFFLAAEAMRFGKGLMIGSEAIRDTPFGNVRPRRAKKVSDLILPMLQVQMGRFAPADAMRLLPSSCGLAWDDVLEEWKESFAQIPQQPMVDVYLDHLLENRIQRRTRPRLDAARWFCQPVYPYMDNELYRAFRSIPLDHLEGERAHLALLSGYDCGIEQLPNAARYRSGIPISREYDCRRFVQFARTVRQTLLLPLDRARQGMTGRSGRARRFARIMEGETERMKACGLFDAEGLERLMARAARGVFIPPDALHSLVSAVVVNDVLCGDGLSGPRAPRFISTRSDRGLQPFTGSWLEEEQT